MYAIDAEDLVKDFTGWGGRLRQRALDHVSLRIEPGTAFGLIGQNGAGKTTFIKTLLGIVRPTGGRVQVLGGHPEDVGVRARIGYLPERLHLPDAWKPPAFLASVARLKRIHLTASGAQALLSRVGLDAAVDRRIGGFSKGMRQRLGLAAALLGQPELLVLDEPTDGIDPLGRVEIRHILADELARGATLFLNSHLLAETERICSRIAVLSHGRVVREGSLESLRNAGKSWQARFAPDTPAEVLTAAGFTAVPERGAFRITTADVEALNAALDQARRAGALLISLEPEARDLEQVLADALGVAA